MELKGEKVTASTLYGGFDLTYFFFMNAATEAVLVGYMEESRK